VDRGYAGYELYDFVEEELRRQFGFPDREKYPVARAYFADGAGYYYVEIFDNTPVPAEIIEELIAETKKNA
jgi:hypothetical protein